METMLLHSVTQIDLPETPREMMSRIIHGSGRFKEVAANIWPHVPLENAKTYLSKALSPDENKFDIDWIPVVCRVTGWDDFLFWLCHRLGYEKPEKKPTPDALTELKELREFKKRALSLLADGFEVGKL